MGYLVADYHTYATKIDGWIDREIEERRLQNSGWEVDVVHRGIVVGVHRGRCHSPLLLIHRLAEVPEVPVVFEHGIACQVTDKVIPIDLERRVIAPLLGI